MSERGSEPTFRRKPTPDGLSGGGELVVEALALHGVDTVFCVPGESYLEVLDALYDSDPPIRVVTCRHEHGAANMAEAYAKLTGKTGVCLVTRGPGACNASIGVHTAKQDSTPMVLLVGQVPDRHRGREAFQEVDYRWMFGDLAKQADQVTETASIPGDMARAFRVAQSGRAGPVVLALPEDRLSERLSTPPVKPLMVRQAEPEIEDLEDLEDLLAEAERPILLLGGGGWTEEGKGAIRSFAETFGMPVATSFRRHDLFDNHHPLFIGDLGIGPGPNLLKTIKSADLIVAVGCRLGEMTTQGYGLFADVRPKLVHVQADRGHLGRVFEPDLAIHAHPNLFALASVDLKLLGDYDRGAWCRSARAGHEQDRKPNLTGGPLDLAGVMAILEDRLSLDAIITVDAGNFAGWPQRFLTFGGGRRLLGPTSGAMGYAVPAAIAAKIAQPKRQVIGCVGDGGFGMTGMELLTAAQEGAAPVILVFNNSQYGTIRMHQEKRHPGRAHATALHNPDFAALARSFGINGHRVERTEDFSSALDKALKAETASVIELVCDPDVITTRARLDDIKGQGT
ncbi:MAG: thiamine pyrophosphate-dependent enzyme [Magnetovibrionaceae bacterium]